MGIDGRAVIEMLVSEGTLRAGPWLERTPPPPGEGLADRVRGMLLGVAIGDALGNTSESMTPRKRRQRYGEIRDYLPNRHANDRPVGLPSDDTQLTFRTVEQLLADGALDPARLLDRFAAEPIFGIGRATSEAIERYRQHGADWRSIGARSAGNGGLMRIAPVLLPYLRAPGPGLWADAVLATAVTHRDAAAFASSVAWVAVLWDILAAPGEVAPARWVERFIAVASEVEPPGTRYRPRGGAWADFEGSFGDWLARCRDVVLSSSSVLEAGDLWYSGAYLLETVPSVLHVLARHAGEPEKALVCAVNQTRDNDTVAAIVGAAVGALHGAGAFPARWVEGLAGRTGADDDGRIFALVEEAVAAFVP